MNLNILSRLGLKSAPVVDMRSVSIAEIVDLINRIDDYEKSAQALLTLTRDNAVAVLDRPELLEPARILQCMEQGKAAQLLNGVSHDRIADILDSAEIAFRVKMLALVDNETGLAVARLMAYPPKTAGSIMTTEFVSVPSSWSVGQTLDYVRNVERTRETVYAIYVLDAATQKLVNVVTLRRLITGAADVPILAIAPKSAPVTADPLMTHEEVARLIRKHDLLSMPVVERDGSVIGIVTVDDVIDTMIAEGTEDAHKMGGLEALAEPYLAVGFGTMIRKRGGWLAALFLGEMLTATAMQGFEVDLEKAIVLTLFIPLIMSSGGNSGSQATSLIIRGLALQDVRLGDWWRVLMREIPAGLAMGAMLGAIGFVRIGIWQGLGFYDYGPHWQLIGLTVGVALTGIVAFGSATGAMLPFILQRLGFDPASASAPLVATLVDVSGLVIYFSVAIMILHGTLL